MVEVDDKEVLAMLRSLVTDIETAWQSSGTFFKNATPIRSGNARSRTRTVGQKITGDYDYASRLDEGYSKQAPQGMIDPTVDYFEKQIDNIVRKHG